ncbi:MAG: PDDEXK nuclease domain-containing protein [Phycisphaerae bacterium]|nr:PDDEXK nuclease domain-containing protein [Phycisphaerae bacterium]
MPDKGFTHLHLHRQYGRLLADISGLLEQARRTAARSLNAVLTSAYWQIGRRIVEHEQGGKQRAEYGRELLVRLGEDLTKQYGRGFSWRNLYQMRLFYQGWEILQTPSAKFEARVICSTLSSELNPPKFQTPSGESTIAQTASAQFASMLPAGTFPLSWSHYVRLMSVDKLQARAFYESEAIRGGWSVRQLDRQISTQFYERTAHSKRPAAMMGRGQVARPEDAVSLQDEVRDPYLLEFLNLKDEYSESELEEALVRHLETFLLELGAGFTFVARQKRIRVGDEWYRIDLLLFHRRLRCVVVIDLKIGKFTHADAGQMNLYLNYTREHMMEPGENDPVGLILCSAKNDTVVHYAMGGIKAKVFASHYLTVLPDPETLRQEIVTTQRAIEARRRLE